MVKIADYYIQKVAQRYYYYSSNAMGLQDLCSSLNLDKFEGKRRHYTTNYQNQPWKKTR